MGRCQQKDMYCNEALTCATPVEGSVCGVSSRTMPSALISFSTELRSICGVETAPEHARREQGCYGEVRMMGYNLQLLKLLCILLCIKFPGVHPVVPDEL